MPLKQLLFSFEGRVSRSRFWLVIAPLIILDVALRVAVEGTHSTVELAAILVLALPTVWIGIAVYAKRWHDLNRSGAMTLLFLIPLINILVFLYLGFAPGTSGANEYGDSP